MYKCLSVGSGVMEDVYGNKTPYIHSGRGKGGKIIHRAEQKVSKKKVVGQCLTPSTKVIWSWAM